MRSIPTATPIILTADERTALEALAHSRKSEARMRDRARIVLLAADGLASLSTKSASATAGHANSAGQAVKSSLPPLRRRSRQGQYRSRPNPRFCFLVSKRRAER